MTFDDLPLTELLKLASVETDSEKLKELIHEISQRYGEQERHIVFDIFSGINDATAVWMAAVSGLRAANERMQKLAASEPGPYFIFHSQSRKIMAQLDNGPMKSAEPNKPSKTGTA